MSQLDILLPFGLPPPEFAKDLIRQSNLPALAQLLARSNFHTENFDPYARALPHETWLARRLLPGIAASDRTLPHGSPPLAPALMRRHGLQADAGTWFVVQPVHFHIASDHLILADPRQLELADDEARALFEDARMLFEESGLPLVYGDAATWFVRADDWRELDTATPDAACGHNIDIWMPRGEAERAWRKLQNEVQMQWHDHAVNAARDARRQAPANSLWLWGGATLSSPSHDGMPAACSDAFLPGDWCATPGAAGARKHAACNAAAVIAAAPQRGLLLLDSLRDAALAEEWGNWLHAMQALEQDWFAPLLTAVQDGRLAQLTLVAGNATRLDEYRIRKSALRKFWRTPSLARLLP